MVINFVDSAMLLTFFGVGCCVFSSSVAFAPGAAGVGSLFALFFLESICYPVHFIPHSLTPIPAIIPAFFSDYFF